MSHYETSDNGRNKTKYFDLKKFDIAHNIGDMVSQCILYVHLNDVSGFFSTMILVVIIKNNDDDDDDDDG